MRFITTNDIENWSNSVDCKYHLPHLIRKLILATIDFNSIKSINFSYGDDIQTGGYDGELHVNSENLFTPLGESVWEFGTTNNKKGKADEDYQKRKADTLGKIPNETIYINVTAKKYRDKKKWADDKKAEGFWKDVRYYDALDVEQWLEIAPAVEIWLAEKLGKPTYGIYSAEEYWNKWSNNGRIKVLPEIIAGNSRSKQIEKVKDFLGSQEDVLYLKSITKDEAIIFPLAIIEQLDSQFKIDLANKTVVIDNKESFSKIIQSNSQLIIIIKFNIESLDINASVLKGHKLIIPLSPSDEIRGDNVQLPIVSGDDFENSLIRMGIDREKSRILTSSTGRNISVLRRALEIDTILPKWVNNIDYSDIIPILILNQFSENSEGDKYIVETITGKNYIEYEKFLIFLLNQEDTPIYHINGVWKLISPTDIWLHFAKFLTKNDYDNISKVAIDILSEVYYKFTIPLEQRGAIFQTSENRPKYSSKLKKGICESLNIISVFGEKYGVNIISSETFVNNVVNEVLSKNLSVWCSLSSDLMVLAEAAPIVFLNNLERIIKSEEVKTFFEEEKGFMGNSNYLPSLLWSLDVIGWMPENLMRVSSALCELILLSPEKLPTSNTPYSSLKSIFRTWYPQTNASAEERKTILGILMKKYPDIVYKLMISMIKSKHDTAFHVPRPKMRLFSELREIRVTNQEIFYMISFYIDNIIETSNGNYNRIIVLIDLIDNVNWDRIDDVLIAIETATSCEIEKKNEIYHQFRKFIGRHRSYPDAHWSLPEDLLEKIEATAKKFKSQDDILNGLFLFEEQAPIFIDGHEDKDYRVQEKIVSEKRIDFIKNVMSNHGLKKVFELSNKTEHSYIFGNILAQIPEISDIDKFEIFKKIDSDNPKETLLAIEFIRVSEIKTSLKEQTNILEKLILEKLSINGTVQFLKSLNSNINLWKYIENLGNNDVEGLYWKSQNNYLFIDDKIDLFFSLNKLSHFKKWIVFLNTLGMSLYRNVKNEITSDEALSLLENVNLSELDDESRFDHNSFQNILEFIYSKDDYDENRGAKIEMKFCFVFDSNYSHLPKNIFKVMSKNPIEYMDFLCHFYLPEDEELRKKELERIDSQENRKMLINFKYHIFDNFNLIPTLAPDGSLNEKELFEWINTVRELAEEKSRAKMTDNCIGKLLAKYPISIYENKGFPIEIYNIIESINTCEMKSAFQIQISNNLGFTTRGAFEGGNIERTKAKYFDTLFEQTKITHPNVSILFKNLKDKYLKESNWEDENALLRSLN